MNPTAVGVKGTGASHRIGFQFRALPCDVAASRTISQSAKILHAALLDAGRRKGACTLTNRTLGGMIGRSVATVKRLLSELEAAGLARRELSAGGRIRSGVVPIAPGVAHSRATVQTTVAHSRTDGGSLSTLGVAHSRPTSIQTPPPEREKSDGTKSPSPGGKEAADYLRRCVAAAKAGEPMPEPPAPPTEAPKPAEAVAEVKPTPRVEAIDPPTPQKAPAPPVGVALARVGGMVRSLADRLTDEGVGPRGTGPMTLARQLAEMRRRHGKGAR